jgi:hypothetical protein
MYYGLLRLGFTGSDFELRDDSDGKGAYIDEWRSDKPQPSAEAIKTAQDEYDTEYASLEYSRNRKEEYPTIEECVHAILDGELDDLQIKRQAIKDKYPKETS